MLNLLYLVVGQPHYSVYKHTNDDHLTDILYRISFHFAGVSQRDRSRGKTLCNSHDQEVPVSFCSDPPMIFLRVLQSGVAECVRECMWCVRACVRACVVYVRIGVCMSGSLRACT